MVRLATLLGIAWVCLGLVACGGDNESEPAATTPEQPADVAPVETAPPEPEPEREPEPETTEQTPTGSDKFTGQDRENYEIAKEVCGAFPAEQSARDLGLTGNRGRTSEELVEIAETYAEGLRPSFRQAAFEGCLDGLPEAAE